MINHETHEIKAKPATWLCLYFVCFVCFVVQFFFFFFSSFTLVSTSGASWLMMTVRTTGTDTVASIVVLLPLPSSLVVEATVFFLDGAKTTLTAWPTFSSSGVAV